MLQCPVCANALIQSEHNFSCQQAHTFDRAREGYVNLLLLRKGTPRVTGDTKPMLVARRDFLKQGYFDFLFNALALCARKELAHADRTASILDIGCGEGSLIEHLRNDLSQGLPEGSPSLNFFGMDVSKDALKMAARAHLKCQFVLANVHQQIPLLDNSTTLITAVCAPRNFNEFSRILTSNGSLVLVIPTPRHLNQLRSFTKLLAIEEEKEQQIIEIASEFKLVERIEVEHTQELTHTTLKAVMTMTPNFWHKEQEMLFPKNLLVTFSFRILVFELSARLSLYSSD